MTPAIRARSVTQFVTITLLFNCIPFRLCHSFQLQYEIFRVGFDTTRRRQRQRSFYLPSSPSLSSSPSTFRNLQESITEGIVSPGIASPGVASSDIDRREYSIPISQDGDKPPSSAGPLSMNIDELGNILGGKGRALIAWDLYRMGVDPQIYFGQDKKVSDSSPALRISSDGTTPVLQKFIQSTEEGNEWEKEIDELRTSSRSTQTLGKYALDKLSELCSSSKGVEGGFGALSHIDTSSDGTTKLLIRLQDGLEVETVIIPWEERGRSTLCVSSQVGCKQGCTFCATGRMGKLRSLTSDEILTQVYYSRKICRIASIPQVDNIVFMGMGEPADNPHAVRTALDILTDRQLFSMASSRVTVSTVAPTPDAFREFENSRCVLAWSVHAADDDLRKKLVPTTKHSMVELRQGLIDVLKKRSRRLRATMLEVALIDGVNDTVEAAEQMAVFAKGLTDQVPGIKLIVNLIPFNDIGHPTFKTPTRENVKKFQDILREHGVLTHTRTTRGDDESAACGQLTTKKRREEITIT